MSTGPEVLFLLAGAIVAAILTTAAEVSVGLCAAISAVVTAGSPAAWILAAAARDRALRTSSCESTMGLPQSPQKDQPAATMPTAAAA